MKTKQLFALLLMALAINGCSFEDPDLEKPEIDLTFENTFPLNCDTLYFGETFTFRSLFTDNAELGSFSIDIHHNFDHHSHSTEVSECALAQKKEPANPFQFTEEFAIPAMQIAYFAEQDIAITSGNAKGDWEEGNYHLFLRLTDKEGWSAQRGVSIWMQSRENQQRIEQEF